MGGLSRPPSGLIDTKAGGFLSDNSLDEFHDNVWEASSTVSRESPIKRDTEDDANVSDDNLDEEDMYENNLESPASHMDMSIFRNSF